MGFSTDFVLCLGARGFHRMAYTDWGAPSCGRVLMAVHGLTRNGRDFDHVAAALEDRYRVVCPDVAGRGKSDWLAHSAEYHNHQYASDLVALIARLDVDGVDWLGTSMGGLIGILLASTPSAPIRRLVLNDIGPWIPKQALQRIADYVGTDPAFEDRHGVEAYFRDVHGAFGDLTDAQWRHLAEHGARPSEGGGFKLAYDPAIGDAFKSPQMQDVDLWPRWDRIECPVLILRGANSDLLPPAVADEMTRRGPRAELVTFERCGHAPALMAPEQIAAIRRWLLS